MINHIDYKLPKNNFINKVYKKTQIVIGNSFNNNMNHYNGWISRYEDYKKTAMFTIDISGNIYQHFDPKYYSNFLQINNIDDRIISIVLENEGWLNKVDDKYYNLYGNEYIISHLIEYKNWRGHQYWVKYNEYQLDSLVLLCKHLCEKFNIKLQTIGHNIKVDDIYDYEGITFRSNYNKWFSDLNPSFEYELFKEKLK